MKPIFTGILIALASVCAAILIAATAADQQAQAKYSRSSK